MSTAAPPAAGDPRALIVRRVFNNSAVLAADRSGRERVLLGKGVGFHLRAGDTVDGSLVDKTFVLTSQDAIAKYSALLADLTDAEVELAQELVEQARSALGEHVGANVLLPLADHINFAIRRAQEGADPIDYELRWEVHSLYPQEVAFARHAVRLIHERLHVDVPQEEAVPLALHFVNARLSSTDMGVTIRTTRVLGNVLKIVRDELDIQVDEDSVSVARLVSHLRYLASGGGSALAPVPPRVAKAVREAQPHEYAVGKRIADYLSTEVGSPPTEQEVVYLTLHINRLRVAAPRRSNP